MNELPLDKITKLIAEVQENGFGEVTIRIIVRHRKLQTIILSKSEPIELKTVGL